MCVCSTRPNVFVSKQEQCFRVQQEQCFLCSTRTKCCLFNWNHVLFLSNKNNVFCVQKEQCVFVQQQPCVICVQQEQGVCVQQEIHKILHNSTLVIFLIYGMALFFRVISRKASLPKCGDYLTTNLPPEVSNYRTDINLYVVVCKSE